MKLRLAFVLVVGLLSGLVFLAPYQVRSESVDNKPGRRVTLLVRTRTPQSDNWDKATVSFQPQELYGSSAEPPIQRPTEITRESSTMPANDPSPKPAHEWDLLYGSLNYNGDGDWFRINCDNKGWSRIRDLGELDWSDEITVPILPILPCTPDRRCGGIQIPSRESGKKIHDEDVNPHVAKPIAGHMYVIHRRQERRPLEPPGSRTQFDYYALVRVEELKPNESCTITWKRIPSPKK